MQKRRAFRPLQPEQITLLPPSPREWLSEDHQVYFLLDLVDEQGVCRPQHPAVSAPLGQLSWSAGGLLLKRRRGGVMRREGESGASVHLPVAAISTCCCDQETCQRRLPRPAALQPNPPLRKRRRGPVVQESPGRRRFPELHGPLRHGEPQRPGGRQ